jgi:hypothetical protein
MAVMRLFRTVRKHENLYLRIRSNGAAPEDLEALTGILVQSCTLVKLKRHEQAGGVTESSFLVEFKDLAHLARAKAELRERFAPLELSFIDNEGLI